MERSSELAARVLLIDSLDDLKARLANVVLIILVVRFFEYALGMGFKTPLDLLQFAAGIALLGLALYLSHRSEKNSDLGGPDRGVIQGYASQISLGQYQ